MQKKKAISIGAALVMALAIVPAAVFWIHPHISLIALLSIGMGIAGTVTVTYQSFQTGQGYGGGYTGGTVPPTTIQSQQTNAVVAQVSFGADTDTIATITHNMNISAAALAALQPYIEQYWQQLAASTNTFAVVTFALTNSNVVTVNKVSNTGTAGTLVVIVRRPWSASQ